MGFLETMRGGGDARDRAATGYVNFLDAAARANQYLANDKTRVGLQGEPLPQLQAGTTQYQANPDPRFAGPQTRGVGLITNGMDPVGPGATPADLAMFRGGAQAGAAAAAPGGGLNIPGQGATWQGVQDFRAGLLPGQNTSGYKDMYPNQQPFYEGPQNSLYGNFAAGLGNFVYNLPGDLANGAFNPASHQAIGEMAGALFTPGYQPPHIVGAYNSDDVVDAFDPSASSGPVSVTQTAPGAGVVAPSPAPGFSSSGGLTTGSVAETGTAPSSTDDFFPREMRDAALHADPGEWDHVQQELQKKRDGITSQLDRVLSLAKQQSDQYSAHVQQQITSLQYKANVAQQAGNVGMAAEYMDQANQLVDSSMAKTNELENAALQAQEEARQLYVENDLAQWTQLAVRAESEFRNSGDPTRLTQIMAAYGQPIAINDAGNGRYQIIDITGEGQGRRRQGTFSAQEIGDMFMGTISDQFRAQRAQAEAERQGKLFDHALEMDAKDADTANQISVEQAKALLSGGEYHEAKELGDGTVVLAPKRRGDPFFVYKPEPEVNEDGVPFSQMTRITF